MAESDLPSPNDLVSRLLSGIQEYWRWLAVAVPVALTLSGLGYQHGYLGTLGLGGLVFSLPLEMYLTTGGVSVVVWIFFLLLLTFVLLIPLAVFFTWLALRLASPGKKFLTWTSANLKKMETSIFGSRRAKKNSAKSSPSPGVRAASQWFLLLSVTACLGAVFIVSWSWVVPAQSLVWSPLWDTAPPAWLGLVALTILLVGFTAGTVIALLGLRRQATVWFLIGFLVVGSPEIASQAGEVRARSMFDNPESHTRAFVWWTQNSTEADGYLVAHQQGQLAYLVAQTDKTEDGKRIIYSTVLDVTTPYRVILLPPGIEASMIPSAEPRSAVASFSGEIP